ncbi:MAG: hypothetical protein LBP79_00180 [Clostridiales bacterium]|jgi:hypothetical protein|nr:hypothetical protein [Clostridiales bacterium]
MEILNNYFGLDDCAKESEVDAVFQKMKAELAEKITLKGAEGETAARESARLSDNYRNAVIFVRNRDFKDGAREITRLIKQAAKAKDDGSADAVQAYLDMIYDKTAYWHYVQAAVYYIKTLYSDALKHLKLARSLDKNNEKYRRAVYLLNEKIMLVDRDGFLDGGI